MDARLAAPLKWAFGVIGSKLHCLIHVIAAGGSFLNGIVSLVDDHAYDSRAYKTYTAVYPFSMVKSQVSNHFRGQCPVSAIRIGQFQNIPIKHAREVTHADKTVVWRIALLLKQGFQLCIAASQEIQGAVLAGIMAEQGRVCFEIHIEYRIKMIEGRLWDMICVNFGNIDP